jgi:hypothetical protein
MIEGSRWTSRYFFQLVVPAAKGAPKKSALAQDEYAAKFGQ